MVVDFGGVAVLVLLMQDTNIIFRSPGMAATSPKGGYRPFDFFRDIIRHLSQGFAFYYSEHGNGVMAETAVFLSSVS